MNAAAVTGLFTLAGVFVGNVATTVTTMWHYHRTSTDELQAKIRGDQRILRDERKQLAGQILAHSDAAWDWSLAQHRKPPPSAPDPEGDLVALRSAVRALRLLVDDDSAIEKVNDYMDALVQLWLAARSRAGSQAYVQAIDLTTTSRDPAVDELRSLIRLPFADQTRTEWGSK
jgi:hypothetical protein